MIKSSSVQHISESAAPTPESLITCVICEASYAVPPHQQYILQASPTLLEATFMSMCHFCFRCRRPACPQCWDEINGICGDCVQETHLQFRVEAAPLPGMLFSPKQKPPQADQGQFVSPLLVCLTSGRFQAASVAKSISTEPVKIVSLSSFNQQALPGSERFGPQPQNSLSIADKTTLPEHLAVVDTSRLDTQSTPIISLVPRERGIQRPSPADADAPKKSEVAAVRQKKSPAQKEKFSFFKLLERILTIISFVLFFGVVTLIILATYSEDINRQIIQLAHIDIRAEIAYLLHLIQQIH